VPRLRYRLIHEAKVPLEKLEASDSPVADLFRMERSRDWKDIVGGFDRLRQHVGDDESLRHTFAEWIFKEVFPRLDMPFDQMPERLSLEGVETMLAERIEEWNRQLAEKNLQKGRREGRQEGLLEGRREGEARALLRLLEKKFGALPKSAQSRIAKAELTRLSEWFDRAVTAERLDDVFDA
jgi:flagellar biosynthesis/type III secretory pathway protein FliH